jgi:hypothetical protein
MKSAKKSPSSRLRLKKRTSINSISDFHKEKEMADFRKWLLALAAVAVLLALGSSSASASIPSPRPVFGIEQPADLSANLHVTLVKPTAPEEVTAENASPPTALLSSSLLFPFVSNQAGFDTGIAIADTSADPNPTLQLDLGDLVMLPSTMANVLIDPDIGRLDRPFNFINRRT